MLSSGVNLLVARFFLQPFLGFTKFAGAASILQHLVANGGQTSPKLFKVGMLSSLYVPPYYNFDDVIPEVRISYIQFSDNVTQIFNCRQYLAKS